jgi:hypothetical protein
MTTYPTSRTYRSAFVAAAAATALILTACSGDGSGDTPASTTSPAATAPSTPLVDAEVGKDITDDGATWTIHSISRNAECDYGSVDEPQTGFELVQFRAGVHNEHAGNAFVFEPTDVVTENGELLAWPDELRGSGGFCEPAPGDDGYINWDDEVEAGTQTFVYGAFAVPENTGFMSIRGHKFAIPEDYIDDVEGPGEEPGPEPSAEQVPAESQGEPSSIWAPTGEGYQCPQTDAFVWDPADCTPENLGAGSLPDPATVPIPDGGTCPAAICGYGHDENGNPNPSSGELQTQDGCEEGYITDPELCAAVGRALG